MLAIFNRKFEWKRLFVFAIVNSLGREIGAVIFAQYNPIIYLALYIIIMIMSFRYIIGFKYIHSLFSVCTLIIIGTGVEYINTAILRAIFHDNFDIKIWLTNFIKTAVMRNTANLLLLLFVLLAVYFKLKINIPLDISKRRVFSIVINVLLTVILIVPNMIFFQNTTIKISVTLITFNAVSVLILLALGIYNSVKTGELETKRQEVEFQNLYIQTLNDSIDGLRGFKHDFNNMVQVIGGYLALGDLNGLKQYHEKIQSESRMINNVMPLNSYVEGNPAVFGLLLSKISYSELWNIKFSVNVLCTINTGSMDNYYFCKVLGILLDNALEAAKETEEKYVELFIKQINKERSLIVEIKNSFSGLVEIENIFKNGYTTKQDHSGFGLWEVRKIVSKQNNCSLETHICDNILTQFLRIEN